MAKKISVRDGMEVYNPVEVEEIERLSMTELKHDITRVCCKILQSDFDEKQKKHWSHPEFRHL